MRSFTVDQAAAFRLRRHHLMCRRVASLADVCRDTGGIQAQVMSAAELAFWTRRRPSTREEIRAALWQRRELVRTTCMRITLHVIPADDYSMYIAAMRPTSRAALDRIFTRLRATPADADVLTRTVMEALADGPQTQKDLIARARKAAGRGLRVWLDHAWVAMRPAIIDGLICYGPPRGAEATFVRVDRWLPAQKTVDADTARAELLRRFLAAFGPASAHDFAKWSGLRTSDARTVLHAMADEVAEVLVDGAHGWILKRDVKALADSRLDRAAVRLLGPFDSLLLAHATKEHLVEPRFYKRVYRAQGWISPVVLQGGRIAGVWFQRPEGREVALDVQLFGRPTRGLRDAIASEAEAMSAFVGARCTPRFVSTASGRA